MLGRLAAISTTNALQRTIASRQAAPTQLLSPLRASAPARPRRSPCLALGLPTGASRRGSVLASLDMREGPPKRALRRLDLSYTHLRAHETVLDLVCRL